MNSEGSSQTPSSLPTGIWGGDHISLDATGSGAAIEYDCAHGSITEKIAPDRDGKFEAKGFYVREGPGPTRQEQEQGQPATYSGAVNGDTMTLAVKLTGTEDVLGTFELTHGKTGRIRKCK